MIAFYYGLTGFACVWYYRSTLRESARNLWLRGILPLLGGLILWFAMVWSFWYNWTPRSTATPRGRSRARTGSSVASSSSTSAPSSSASC